METQKTCDSKASVNELTLAEVLDTTPYRIKDLATEVHDILDQIKFLLF